MLKVDVTKLNKFWMLIHSIVFIQVDLNIWVTVTLDKCMSVGYVLLHKHRWVILGELWTYWLLIHDDIDVSIQEGGKDSC